MDECARARLSVRPFFSLAAAFALFGCLAPARAQHGITPHIEAIRFWSFGDVTRIAIQTQGSYQITSNQIDTPPRLYFDLNGLRPPASARRGVETFQVGDHRLKKIRISEIDPGTTRVIFDLEGPVDVVSSQLVNPDRLMIELRPKDIPPPNSSIARNTRPSRRADLPAPVIANPSPTHAPATEVPAPVQRASVSPPPPTSSLASMPTSPGSPMRATVPAPKPTGPPSAARRDSTGDRSLVRVFGLKMAKVVIDAGHGGHDTGTIGPNGLMEKDLVLDVALRLGALITQRLGAQVIYTRSDDVFIPLEDRTRIANDEKADLFISIHANSSPEPSATGVETYYFNLHSDKAGLDLATRENATSESAISDLSDLLHKAVLQTKLEESRDFAQKVQASLWAASVKMNNRSRDRGVRQAPFVVLIGATMPSILAEIGFVSNPHDERLMKRTDQRQKIAESLFRGVSQYANSLSHIQIARASGQ
ncbi:MAG TPA: N-acetylmuramoyl-L-alanine amidase [Bryobacteraceae bacterium]|nr:N-acetylmuramoyl-L-alanine amidase [Bryobacteraceae bacterium]